MKAQGLKSFADLETLYEQRLLDMLKAQGTSYIVWQEIFDNGAKIASDTVIDVWKGGNWQDEMASVTKAGFHSVLSAPSSAAGRSAGGPACRSTARSRTRTTTTYEAPLPPCITRPCEVYTSSASVGVFCILAGQGGERL